MAKSLVIVESPAKAKTINKYLGKDYFVLSSVGHIRDLPTSGGRKPIDPKERARQAAITRKMKPEDKAAHRAKKEKEQMVRRMGINPFDDWKADYQILPGKEKVLKELKKIGKDVDQIYLATDLDREGEAIAWHLREAIGGSESKYRRVVFNEITKKAIQAAFKEPGELDMSFVEAQQTRRFLDRVVGYMISPLLWAKVARGLSAGRVQSVAVRLVVEREREIHSFIPEEYWEVFADVENSKKKEIRFQVKKFKDTAFKPVSKDETDSHLSALNAAEYVVVNKEERPTSSKPTAPFITSTLQQAGATRLGFSVKKVMTMAQRLYEAGYITYMRTDSTNLSQDALDMVRSYIEEEYGKDYLPENPVKYSSKEGAQEAHEAVRPTDVKRLPGTITGIDPDAEKVYDLIWRRFVACQMNPARYLSTRITLQAGEYELKANGRVIQFEGYLKVLPPMKKNDDEAELPQVTVGEILKLIEIDPIQHFTKPPPRYTEASLVKELEKRSIGRPSTYVPIISTIRDRGYVRVENKRFYAEKIGDIVTDRLVENFDDLMNYDFTAKMEGILDDIAKGEKNWKKVLDSYFEQLSADIDKAKEVMRSNDPVDIEVPCPTCERPMQIRTGGTGVFLGCSGYNLPPKERCKTTINLIRGDEVVSEDDDAEQESKLLRTRHRCKKCGTAMDSYLIDETRKLHVCGNSPDCDGYEIEQGKFRLKGYDGPTLECDKCGSEMQLKTGPFGKYFGCTNAECKNTRKLLRNGEAAPPKMDPVAFPELACEKVEDFYLLRDGASGLFFAASKFPRNRETRTPYLFEILPRKKEIDPKYTYLYDGPIEDPAGNKTMIRFSRKTKTQYLMTEIEGKATGWRAEYEDGKWKEVSPIKEDGPKKTAAKKKTSKKKAAVKG
jgi:DNA topoisomerase-1